ncbi:MAG: type II toxin-antitoxin system VapC family toxin [Acidobacteria bacterium]|jgi:PIN domain nuclease of toxin-antitoxin system|nr:type II toxin-antitoxin system VapC family toxin [Acidobacteriota bacterium]
MRLLLDTATLIFAVESPARLSKRAASLIQNGENILELSAISLVEIAVNVQAGKLHLTRETVERAIRDLDVRILPYTAEHALQLFALPRHHSDPFDRQLIAQAIAERIPMLTPDEALKLYKGLKVLW